MGRWADSAILALGGALGVHARYWLSAAIEARFGQEFPWGTLIINVSGSFALGVAATLLSTPAWLPYSQARLLVMVGFLGGYTTFSTFSLQAVELWSRSGPTRSLAYTAASLLGGLAAALLGLLAARSLLGRP